MAISGSLVGELKNIVIPVLNALGFDLIRLKILGSANITLQIMAERKNRSKITIEDCTKISREISNVLDGQNFFTGAYSLEISSPGIDRPLIAAKDYLQYVGFVVKAETRLAIEGKKRFEGLIVGLENNMVILRQNEKTYLLPITEIVDASLVLTDKLLQKSKTLV